MTSELVYVKIEMKETSAMQVSSNLVYILIFKQVISLTEAFQDSFGVLNDQKKSVKIYLQFTFIDSTFSLKLLCCFIHSLSYATKIHWTPIWNRHCTWH